MAPLDHDTAQDVHEIIEEEKRFEQALRLKRANMWAVWIGVVIAIVMPLVVTAVMRSDMASTAEVQQKYDALSKEDKVLQLQIIDMRETVTRTETKIDMLLKSGGLRFEPR